MCDKINLCHSLDTFGMKYNPLVCPDQSHTYLVDTLHILKIKLLSLGIRHSLDGTIVGKNVDML